jgi:general secretion pathway protein E
VLIVTSSYRGRNPTRAVELQRTGPPSPSEGSVSVVAATTESLTPKPLTLAEGLSREYLLHHRVCPKGYAPDGALVVAVGPDAPGPDALAAALDDVALVYRCAVVTEPVTTDELERLVERLTARAERLIELARADALDGLDAGDALGDGLTGGLTADVRDLANQPPVVRYVNLLVRDAYDAGASDVHLEGTRAGGRGGLAARFRLDGVLTPAPEPPAGLAHAVVSRIKLLAELDIAERRRPQDGRIRVRLEARELDLRVSTVPTMHGESVVLRLLDRGGRPVGLDELGMPAPVLERVARLAERPHGMVLVTGPTGSGKTTTLYAALLRRPKAAEKIVTVEDPVEYQLPGITQVPVHRPAGVTFGAALRSILRQDPDVIMVGEMRDRETAEVAVQAAMTGHLVFSTLHTNDAVSAVPRLLDLGVPGYLVAAVLEGVLAQRLVRRVCEACRVEYAPSAERAERLALLAERGSGGTGGTGETPPLRLRLTLVRGAGCAACRGTGYRGRLGIFELLVPTDAFKDAVARGAALAELRALAAEGGLVPMRSDGRAKVEAGLTTIEEVLGVVQS